MIEILVVIAHISLLIPFFAMVKTIDQMPKNETIRLFGYEYNQNFGYVNAIEFYGETAEVI